MVTAEQWYKSTKTKWQILKTRKGKAISDENQTYI